MGAQLKVSVKEPGQLVKGVIFFVGEDGDTLTPDQEKGMVAHAQGVFDHLKASKLPKGNITISGEGTIKTPGHPDKHHHYVDLPATDHVGIALANHILSHAHLEVGKKEHEARAAKA